MNFFTKCGFILIVALHSHGSIALQPKESQMNVNGSFEVALTPVKHDEYAAGRMLINKTYSGKLAGTGKGQMLSKRTQNGASVYSAIEEFVGKLDGKSGGFTLVHSGYMSANEQTLSVIILQGSGTGELTGIEGSMDINKLANDHTYALSYKLNQGIE